MSIDLGLKRIKQLSAHLLPYTRPTIHIAGTNGKGSVSAYLSSILHASGLKVARFNSPHLLTTTDSIVINNSPIQQHTYDSTHAQILRACKEHGVQLSNFEILTMCALCVFEAEKVDVAVVEVGMGGLRDATNVIPDGCVVTSALTAVDLDHQAFLGSTVGEIAKEKSGIARPGRPFVLGKQRYPEVDSVVRDTVSQCGGILLHAVEVTKRNWDEKIDGPLPPAFSLLPLNLPPSQPISAFLSCFKDAVHALLPLHGDHQLDNLGVALGIISALHSSTSFNLALETISKGIKETQWPGRLSFHTLTSPSSSKPMVVLADGAHNPASAKTLSSYITYLLSLLPSSKVRITYILGLSHSPPKTPLETLSPLLPPTPPLGSETEVVARVAAVGFTPPEGMPWVRAVTPKEVSEVSEVLTHGAAEIWAGEDVKGALEWAGKGEQEGRQELVILAGSLYVVADFYRIAGV